MVDGVLLLVDAVRGPAAADALRAAQGARAPPAGDPRRSTRSTGRTRASPRSSTRSTSCSSTSTPPRTRSSSRSSTRTPRPASASLDPTDRGHRPEAADGPAARHDPGARVRGGPPAAGARHQPRRVALRRPPRDLPRAQRHDPQGRSRSPGAAPTARSPAREDRRALHHRGARPRRRRRGRPGRDHRRRRPAPTSRSARRSPTPRTRSRCRSSPSTSRRSRVTIGINTSPLAGQDGDQAHRPPDQGPARRRDRSATSRSACSTPSARTPGRSRAAASCSWRSSSR